MLGCRGDNRTARSSSRLALVNCPALIALIACSLIVRLMSASACVAGCSLAGPGRVTGAGVSVGGVTRTGAAQAPSNQTSASVIVCIGKRCNVMPVAFSLAKKPKCLNCICGKCVSCYCLTQCVVVWRLLWPQPSTGEAVNCLSGGCLQTGVAITEIVTETSVRHPYPDRLQWRVERSPADTAVALRARSYRESVVRSLHQ